MQIESIKINKMNNNSNLFDQFLIEFQEDIKRIVGKKKKSFHALSDEEIYSECNLHLLKNKDKILETFKDKELTQSDFKKIAYHYAKNECVWSHYRFQNQAYNRRKSDGFIQTDEGTQTIFDSTIQSKGKENEDLDNDKMFIKSNVDNFLHILSEYSYILSATELKIVSYIKAGLNQELISQKLGVTHQAISFACIEIQKKLNNYFSFEEIKLGASPKSISKGNQSIENFFSK